MQYRKKVIPFTQNIYTTFGTAFHETLQTYLEILYHNSVKEANEMDINKLLYDNMIKAYRSGKAVNGHEHYSTADELNQFWLDGKHILDFIKKKRGVYFGLPSRVRPRACVLSRR